MCRKASVYLDIGQDIRYKGDIRHSQNKGLEICLIDPINSPPYYLFQNSLCLIIWEV